MQSLNTKVLESAKYYIGVAIDDDDSFDKNLLISLNSYVAVVSQLIDINPIFVTEDTTYAEIFSGKDYSESLILLVIHYVSLRARLDFDPPIGSILESLKNARSELEERIMYEGGSSNVDESRFDRTLHD